MCNCSTSCSCSSISLPIGSPGATGAPGVGGTNGIFGGFSGEWIFSTSTSTGPGVTFLRLNNAIPSLVTSLYVADTNTDSIDYGNFLQSLYNDGNYGFIRLFKKSDSTKFWVGRVISITDNSTDHTIGVEYISSNSTFATSDAIVLTFSPAGDTLKWTNLIFNGSGKTYTTIAGIVGYTTIAQFIYPGTTIVAPIIKLKAIIGSDHVSNIVQVRVYDITNSLTIADFSAGTASLTDIIVDLGIISNLPVTQAIFAVQITANAATRLSRISNLLIGQY